MSKLKKELQEISARAKANREVEEKESAQLRAQEVEKREKAFAQAVSKLYWDLIALCREAAEKEEHKVEHYVYSDKSYHSDFERKVTEKVAERFVADDMRTKVSYGQHKGPDEVIEFSGAVKPGRTSFWLKITISW